MRRSVLFVVSLVLALTWTPTLSLYFIRGKHEKNRDSSATADSHLDNPGRGNSAVDAPPAEDKTEIADARQLLAAEDAHLGGFFLRVVNFHQRWLRRALVATLVPTLLVLVIWGGPATGTALFGWNIYIPVTNFTPYWLAIDSNDTLYATDASGDLIWVFDSNGSAQGTIRASPPSLILAVYPDRLRGNDSDV